jgi:lipoprotein-anchoring transpeptidase ErfK/SrfK
VTLVAGAGAAGAGSSSTVAVAFLQGEQLVTVHRPGRTSADALHALLAGTTAPEAGKGLRTYLPRPVHLRAFAVDRGVATVDVASPVVAGRPGEAIIAEVSQLVKTLSAFPTIQRVQVLVSGKPVTRTIEGISLAQPISMRDLQTPHVPVPTTPPLRLKQPDAATKDAQQHLIKLHYLLRGDDDGKFGPATSEAILAFQKYEGLERSGVLDAATQTQLADASEPTPVTQGGTGKRAEILLDRQVALLINGDRVVRAIAVSSGKPSTPTPPGSYKVYAKIPRWWSVPFREWLPWALPFVGGIAFHEFGSVPAYPASHGCVRQSFTVARWTYNFARVGMPVRVIGRS